MHWILIIMIFTGPSGVAINKVDVATLQQCESIAANVVAAAENYTREVRTVCVFYDEKDAAK